jgi:hypothetical protein
MNVQRSTPAYEVRPRKDKRGVDLISASYGHGVQARIVTKRGRRGRHDAQLSAPALHLPTRRATDRVE